MSLHRRVEAGPAGGFDVYTHRFDEQGPRVAVLGGVHGDETEGILAAGRLATADLEGVAGRVDVVPVCHESAFGSDARLSPLDDGNLARAFPGDPRGTPTAVLAHHIFREVLDGVDFLIDLHTSGRSYAMPFLAGYRGTTPGATSEAARAAIAFGADFVWRHPGRSEGRTVSVVDQAIYVESPGGGPASPSQVDSYNHGVLRVLQGLGVVAGAPPRPDRPPRFVTGGGDLDGDMLAVSENGIFLTDLSAGDEVATGERLGWVVDVHDRTIGEYRAERPGWVMALKHRSPVRTGDLVVCLADADTAAPGS